MSSQLDLIVNPGTGGRNDGPHLAEDLAGHLLSPGYLSSLGDQSGDTFYSSVIAIKYTLYSMNLNYFSSLIQEAGQSKEYEEDNRNINLLERDIFIDFEDQFSNDTNQVHAFITTDQDK